MMLNHLLSLGLVALLCALQGVWASTVVPLTSENLDSILKEHELVFVNFYADWCRFSNQLTPIFEQGSDKVAELYPESGRVVFAKVDCDRQPAIASKFHISKYPTLKYFRFGTLMKKEYRGQRSPEAFASFVEGQLRPAVELKKTMGEMRAYVSSKATVLGYFSSKEAPGYLNLERVASQMKSECQWLALIGPDADPERPNGVDKITFRPVAGLVESFEDVSDYDALLAWAHARCIPLVRELTFENAEELTEEGLPFLILFTNPTDKHTPMIFKAEVERQLSDQKTSVNFLVADGVKFAHPLHHLGKSQKDLPIIAIDSFKHMYVFKHDVKTQLQNTGYLKDFVVDLHSGKLHREFHHGPDKPAPTQAAIPAEGQKHIPVDAGNAAQGGTPETKTSPPESTFRKLLPSANRYTVLRDEL